MLTLQEVLYICNEKGQGRRRVRLQSYYNNLIQLLLQQQRTGCGFELLLLLDLLDLQVLSRLQSFVTFEVVGF